MWLRAATFLELGRYSDLSLSLSLSLHIKPRQLDVYQWNVHIWLKNKCDPGAQNQS